MKQYDYLIIGAGLYGSICAHELNKKGKRCLVIDKRSHIGGNCYTENKEGIHVHTYGPHIFHTNSESIWNWINQFVNFNNFINSPVAVYQDKTFSLPFNMWTFNQMWGVRTPEEAIRKIESQKFKGTPSNLEEQAMSLVGRDIYEALIKGYTEKQWGKKCSELPRSIITRLPVRLTYNNNYFNDRYQGIPIGGYTQIFDKLLEGIEVKLDSDYFEDRNYWDSLSENQIYTGPIDKYFDYKHGSLEYRSVKWESRWEDTDNYQGNAVVNYTEAGVKHTRSIEHRHFDQPNSGLNKTYVSLEFSQEYKADEVDPFYPIRNSENESRYQKYKEEASRLDNVHFGGRLATYKYYDMHQIIAQALASVNKINA